METTGKESSFLVRENGFTCKIFSKLHLFWIYANSLSATSSNSLKLQFGAVFSGACNSVPLHPSTSPSYPAEGTHRIEFCADTAEHLQTVLSKIKDIQEIFCLTTFPVRYLLHSNVAFFLLLELYFTVVTTSFLCVLLLFFQQQIEKLTG